MQQSRMAAKAAPETAVMAEPDYVATAGGHRLFVRDWGFGPPILFLHGERDRVVPVRYGRALFEAAPEPKEGWFAPEAGHEDLARYGSLDAVIAFIEHRLHFQSVSRSNRTLRRARPARLLLKLHEECRASARENACPDSSRGGGARCDRV